MRFPPRYVDAVDFVDGAAQRTRVAARASFAQVHAEPERLQPAQAAASQKGIAHMRLNQRLLSHLCHAGTAEQVRSLDMISAHCYAYAGIVFFLRLPNWTHASRGYNKPSLCVVSAQDGLAAGISWRSSFFPTRPTHLHWPKPPVRSCTSSSFSPPAPLRCGLHVLAATHA